MKKKITLLNIITNIILQTTNILTWFIIPKIILRYFGSEINGLVSSITQFLSYISLIEGGITGVVMASLYKPLVDNDYKKISSIIKTSDNFYKRIGIIFIIYCIILAIIYPIIFQTGFTFLYVSSLVLVLSISLIVQYMYSLSLKNLLNAGKKGYIVSITQTLILLLTIVLSYISVCIYPSIHILKLISGLLFIIQPIIYKKNIKKYYKIDYNVMEDKKLIKERWNGFAINIAAFIHNSTDIIILTIFTNLTTVSIYSIYNIVTMGLRSIINAISNAIVPTIGHAYVKKDDYDLNLKMDIFELILFNLIFIIFTVASLLIAPFILIYTKGINDANYNQPIFGVILVIAEAIYLIKFAHLNLAYSASKFKELTIPSFIEAFINIVISLILVTKCGLIGVAIGTICGMIYRMIYQVHFTTRLIKDRKPYLFYLKLLIFSFITIIGLFICNYLIPVPKIDIMDWIWHAVLYVIIFSTLCLIIDIIFYKNELKYLKKYIIKKNE